MRMHLRRDLSRWALLALLFFVFDSVGPVLAASLGAPQKSLFTEVCASDGLKRVIAADASTDAPASNESGFKCPLCPLSGADAAIDVSPSIAAWRTLDAVCVVPTTQAPRRVVYLCIAPPPRGPPTPR